MARAISLLALASAALTATLLTGCGSTRSPLPTYEPPLARTDVQDVRMTAYTHTEADHLEYGNHNALGGTLHAAGPPVEGTTAAVMSVAGPTWQEALAQSSATATQTTAVHTRATAVQTRTWPTTPAVPVPDASPPVYGSAAADWSRWPAGTTFRIVSSGQLYRVDDYGWALSGRNTIDLYQPTRAAMNAWGVRREPIQILQWGDRAESLRRLRNHQGYRHIKRMVLELEGHNRAAARLE